MKILPKAALFSLLIALWGASSPGQAAVTTLFLDQSNVAGLPDGVSYLKVDITDVGDLGTQWRFDVDALTPPLVPVGANFGIDVFAFNSTQPIQSITFGTLNYSSEGSGNADGFGNFEQSVGSDTGTATTDPIHFFVNFASAVLPGWWEENSTGGGEQGHFWFAAHVQDISAGTATSAWFGGNATERFPPTGLPEPGTLALIGLALTGLGFAHRRRK
jgi:hypothetical protein